MRTVERVGRAINDRTNPISFEVTRRNGGYGLRRSDVDEYRLRLITRRILDRFSSRLRRLKEIKEIRARARRASFGTLQKLRRRRHFPFSDDRVPEKM